VALKELFQLCDEDKNGTISKKELKSVMNELGVPTDESEVNLLFKRLDINNDGSITFSEFVKGLGMLGNVCFFFLFDRLDGGVECFINSSSIEGSKHTGFGWIPSPKESSD